MNYEAAIATLNMQLDNCAKDMYEKDKRIAELERQLAEASAPAVEQKPVAVIRQINEVNRTAVVTVTASNHWNIDVAIGDRLYAAPQAADTDKVRDKLHSAIMNLPAKPKADITNGVKSYDCAYNEGHRDARHAAAELVAAMAAQAPVREVPGWISVKDRLPAQGVPVFVYTPANKYSDERIDFDCIDPEDDTASTWDQHNQHYEHWCCVAKPEGSIGPSAEAPYTHWMAFPAAPVQQEGE